MPTRVGAARRSGPEPNLDCAHGRRDWITLRSHERGTPMPQPWLDYRQALRDLPAAVTDEQSLMAVAWPQAPTA